MKTTTKLLLGMVGAAAAGAAIGMLLAPEKGSDLRDKIRHSTREWLNEIASLLRVDKPIGHEIASQDEGVASGSKKGAQALSEKI